MGIVEKEIANTELPSGKKIEIEDNLSGKIHIHIGDLRIELTPEEYRQFRQVILDGYEELQDLKDDL